MSRRIITLDGNNFSDIEGFYDETVRVFTKDLTWNTGRNLNAFADLLRGGFGVHDYGEPICIRWLNSGKSRKDLGYSETAKYYENLLKVCHPTNVESIRNCVSDAKEETGGTFFDMVISAIEFEVKENGFDWKIELI